MPNNDSDKKRRQAQIDLQVSRSYHLERGAGGEGAAVIGCAYQKCLPHYRVRRRRFQPFCVEYVVRGRGQLHAGGKKYGLAGGMVFSYGGGEKHAYFADPGDPMEKMHVAFRGRGARAQLQRAMGAVSGAAVLAVPDEVCELFELLLREAATPKRNGQAICNAFLGLILLKIESLRVPKGRGAQASSGTLNACKTYIDTNFITMQSPAEAAAAHGVSASYMCRLFKRYIGLTPHAYLQQRKMNQAAHLLLTGDMSVKEIAYQLHFGNPFNFSRAFKRHFGQSPRAYRQAAL